MKKFIESLSTGGEKMDFTTEDGITFVNPTTEMCWLCYKLGHMRGQRARPAWGVVAKVTEKGLVISKKPVGHTSAAKLDHSIYRLEKKYKGTYIGLSMPSAQYLALKHVYKGNPEVLFDERGEIVSIPIIFRN